MKDRVKVSKIWSVDEYDYMCVKIKENNRDNQTAMVQLYHNNKLEKQHLLDLGLCKWNFHFRFGETFEFMVQKLRKQ